jgi:hypothetical protein
MPGQSSFDDHFLQRLLPQLKQKLQLIEHSEYDYLKPLLCCEIYRNKMDETMTLSSGNDEPEINDETTNEADLNDETK